MVQSSGAQTERALISPPAAAFCAQRLCKRTFTPSCHHALDTDASGAACARPPEWGLQRLRMLLSGMPDVPSCDEMPRSLKDMRGRQPIAPVFAASASLGSFRSDTPAFRNIAIAMLAGGQPAAVSLALAASCSGTGTPLGQAEVGASGASTHRGTQPSARDSCASTGMPPFGFLWPTAAEVQAARWGTPHFPSGGEPALRTPLLCASLLRLQGVLGRQGFMPHAKIYLRCVVQKRLCGSDASGQASV